MSKIAAFALVAALIGYGFHAVAQSRIDVRPTLTPVGTSSSNGVSFAWFYDATERAVYVCRAGLEARNMIECNVTTKLP